MKRQSSTPDVLASTKKRKTSEQQRAYRGQAYWFHSHEQGGCGHTFACIALGHNHSHGCTVECCTTYRMRMQHYLLRRWILDGPECIDTVKWQGLPIQGAEWDKRPSHVTLPLMYQGANRAAATVQDVYTFLLTLLSRNPWTVIVRYLYAMPYDCQWGVCVLHPFGVLL